MTSSLQERFLHVFQGDVRNHILSFSKLLWERESDVFIFMARKAACFFDCLRELKIADIRGVALSDRILDMDLSFLRDKRVTLVDDCIFTGTTLYNAKLAVTANGCKSFETMTLAVNSDSIRPELLPGRSEWDDLRIQTPLHSMSDSDCVRQCYDIVRAISLVPRPYDVDFPHSRTVKLKPRGLNALLNLPGWQAVEGTSDFQKMHDVRAFTLFPHGGITSEYYDRHGHDCGKDPDLKIRLYARLAGSSYSVRCVPIAMFPGIDHSDIAASLSSSVLGGDSSLAAMGFTSAHSQYRLLHFLAAHSLLHLFTQQAREVIGITGDDIRDDLADMSFGIGFWNKYRQNWPDLSTVTFPRPSEHDVRQLTTDYDPRPVTVNTDTSLVSESIAPFTWLYKQREIATRKFVKESGLQAAIDSGYSHLNRLCEGFAPGALFKRIDSTEFYVPWAVSSLLDRLVDMGIAVPTVVDKDEVCLRAFRHGEDAILGDAQERLVLQAMSAYLTARSSDELWGLEFQKAIVLFAQVGIRNGLLDRLNLVPSVPAPVRILSIKGHLHGPVPIFERSDDPSGTMSVPFVAGTTSHPTWLVDEWVNRDFLIERREQQGRKYTIKGMPSLSIGIRGDAQARQIGRCLGKAVAIGALNSDTDLVMLSTCTEPDHLLRALSGEIAIFRERWPVLRQRLLECTTLKQFASADNLLRSYKDVFSAINSGAMKFSWYTENKVSALVTAVSERLRASGDEAMADEWVQLWPQSVPIEGDEYSYVWATIAECGRWLMSLNVAMRLLDHWFVMSGLKEGQLTPVRVAKSRGDLRRWIKNTVKEFKGREHPKFVEMLYTIQDRIGREDEPESKIWCNEAGRVLAAFSQVNSKLLLDEITSMTSAYGAIEGMTAYPYALFYDVEPGRRNSIELHRAIEAALEACDVETFRFIPENQNPWRTGNWVILSGSRNSVLAAQMCDRIAKTLQAKQIRYRAVIIGQLSNDDCIRAFTNSTVTADGFFFVRVSQLREHLLNKEYCNTVTIANEQCEAAVSEFEKYSAITSDNRCHGPKLVECKDESAPTKVFAVTSFVNKSLGCVVSKRGSAGDTEETSKMVVLICTATDKEDDVLGQLIDARGYRNEKLSLEKGTYRDLGNLGNARVYWCRSGMGSGGAGGSLATTLDAIDSLKPHYVISCGLAFGADCEKQQIGDVLISESVMCYEKGRQEPTRFVPRGPRAPADPLLLQAARSTRLDLKPLRTCEGLLLSGEKLVDDQKFKKALLKLEREAIGGEMEGAGILDACVRRTARWVVIKAICDWAENKEGSAQPQAAENAFNFVLEMIANNSLPISEK